MHLRRLQPSDGAFMLALLNDPGFLRFVGDREVRSEAQAVDYLQRGILRSYAEHGFGMYLCERRDDGAPMGICGLVKRDSLPDFDLGYALLAPFAGHGYALEAAAAIVAEASQRQLPRILAIVQPDNARSIRLLEKLGFADRYLQPATEDDCALWVYSLSIDAIESHCATVHEPDAGA